MKVRRPPQRVAMIASMRGVLAKLVRLGQYTEREVMEIRAAWSRKPRRKRSVA